MKQIELDIGFYIIITEMRRKINSYVSFEVLTEITRKTSTEMMLDVDFTVYNQIKNDLDDVTN